jgi:hypothetical protein
MGTRQATRLGMLVLAGGLVVAGCPALDEPAADPPDEPAVTTEAIEGTLAGDPQLEGGCAWVETAEGRYEVLWPDGYEVQFEPLQLVDPAGDVVARQGDAVTVRGAPADVLTTCMVGRPFQAEAVEPS